MNSSQFIAIVVAPLSLLVVGFGIFLWAIYADKSARREPATDIE